MTCGTCRGKGYFWEKNPAIDVFDVNVKHATIWRHCPECDGVGMICIPDNIILGEE